MLGEDSRLFDPMIFIVILHDSQPVLTHILCICVIFECIQPNIIKVVDTFQTESMIYIVMELLRGGDLFDRIIEKERYTVHTFLIYCTVCGVYLTCVYFHCGVNVLQCTS